MTSPRPLLLLFFVLFSAPAVADETFPQPPELQPDVDFWTDIFTRYSTNQGVLHDSRNLAVVYEHIDFKSSDGRRTRQRASGKRRDALKTILRSLASGKRDNLTDDEARVLGLWPDDVSNATLASAVDQIRYQQGLKDRFREGLIRAGRWRSFINAELQALNVPIELAALPHVESSYNPAARSHVGASGIWQFTRSTGQRFMRVDHVLDERNDPFVASQSAGQLLAYNYSIAGNWPMAITAYNHGLGGALRAMREFGDEAYVDILRQYDGRTFGFASRNFYVAFLAAKHVDQNVEQYFPNLKLDDPVDYATLQLDSYIALEDLADALGVSGKKLASYNLALQATIVTGNKHLPAGFEVRVPRAALAAPIEQLAAAVPASSWQDEQLPDLFHTVRRGDTLSQIAETYKTRASTLVALNGLRNSHSIRAGQKLRLPAAGPAPVIVAQVEEEVVVASAPVPELTEIEEEQVSPFVLSGDLAAALQGTLQTALLSDPSDYSVAADQTIEVHPLETLGHYGDWLEIKTQRLRDLNGLAFRTPVEVGDRIRLDLSDVDATTFETRREEFHRRQQDAFFREHIITGITEHEIVAGESVWILSLRKYDVPIWLFRQYNPGLDLHNIRPGMKVQFPEMSTP
ncbi:MAG: LysM peptidoglycan-binding domain-containing protein [Woeseiaceae bacterium]